MGAVKTTVGLLCLAFCLTATSAAIAHYGGGGGKDCKAVVYTPNSDDVAGSIQAKNISCKKARKVVKHWDKGDEEPNGFECRFRGRGDGDSGSGLGHTDVKCTDGKKQVVWARY